MCKNAQLTTDVSTLYRRNCQRILTESSISPTETLMHMAYRRIGARPRSACSAYVQEKMLRLRFKPVQLSVSSCMPTPLATLSYVHTRSHVQCMWPVNGSDALMVIFRAG